VFIFILFLMVRWNDLNKHLGWYDAYLMVISCVYIFVTDWYSVFLLTTNYTNSITNFTNIHLRLVCHLSLMLISCVYFYCFL